MVELSIIVVLYILGAVRSFLYFDLLEAILEQDGISLHPGAKIFATLSWPVPVVLYLFSRSGNKHKDET